ncbi:c-type cytochrome [Rhodovulum strictum]|uniref:C-type cytochrome n=1 Tax=Rhodovulum strictum TaxID=58314 RepID=A0A844BIW9_9RHOB|nr:cytochrome c [Rhodovulum strictum]MRH21495.1 c-type cytochrome [Rhodovulum strictum]
MRIPSAALALCLAAAPLAAEPPSGAALFRAHCATCHGLAARGDGPMAAILTVAMPDLSLLAADQGGAFPLARVIAVIDGRTALAGHGGPMPLYGFSLRGEAVALTAPSGEEIRTSAEIAAIARWLESIQR